MKLKDILRGDYDIQYTSDLVTRMADSGRYVGALKMLMLIAETLSNVNGGSTSDWIKHIDENIELSDFIEKIGLEGIQIITKTYTGNTQCL